MLNDLWQTAHALLRSGPMCLCMLATAIVSKKKTKKKNVKIIIITASFNTAHIDWSGIRILGANRLNINAP